MALPAMLTITKERVAILVVTGLLLWSWGPTLPHVAAAVAAVALFWWFAGPRRTQAVLFREKLDRLTREFMSSSELQRPTTPNAITSGLLDSTPDDVLEYVLCNYVGALMGRAEALASLPPGLQAHYIAFTVDAEVLNGGFNQLFFNAPELAKAAPLAFEHLGMHDAAGLATRACELYESIHPRHIAARQAGTMEAFMATYDEQPFEALDAEYASGEDRFRDERLRYVRAHPQEFVHP